jgi:hypothetical protein
MAIKQPMTIKQQLIQEIEQAPDFLLRQLLDFLLFLKQRHNTIEIETDITEEEAQTIVASQLAYEAGDSVTLEEYEMSQV